MRVVVAVFVVFVIHKSDQITDLLTTLPVLNPTGLSRSRSKSTSIRVSVTVSISVSRSVSTSMSGDKHCEEAYSVGKVSMDMLAVTMGRLARI